MHKGKPGSIYKLFQEEGAGKCCQRQSGIASVIFYENKATEDPALIANAFKCLFVNVASKIKEHITPSNHDKPYDFYKFSNHDKLKDFCSSKNSQDT